MVRKSWGLLAVALLSAPPARAVDRAAAPRPKAAAPRPKAAAPRPKAAPGPGAAPSPLLEDRATGMKLLLVKGACYRMGDIYRDGVSGSGEAQDEQPVHEVCVDDFYIGKYEVTQGQWKAIMKKNPTGDASCRRDDCPVDSVSWSDVQEFLRRLNEKAGGTRYRLPTEAEWEYAARSGGKNERYSGGNDVDSVAWYEANSGYRTEPLKPIYHPVGTKLPNGLGLHDMSGNVYEITSDWYGSGYYASSPRDNPRGPESGEARVKRGGCGSGHAGNSRTARRAQFVDADGSTGLRVARTP